MRVFALCCGVVGLLACGNSRQLGGSAGTLDTPAASTPASAKTSSSSAPPSSTPASSDPALRDLEFENLKFGIANDNLNAVLFVQTAGEYAALTRQAYAAATSALSVALLDSMLSADPIQAATGNYRRLPPAVIVDIDETVLDNSAFQARLIRDEMAYNSASWKAWTDEAVAPAIPGALDFAQAASAQGVTIFYVSNRRAEEEAATRRNLLAVGFPVTDREDVLLMKAERPLWSSSDKTPRRAEVARTHRIVMMIGDNLGDFLEPGNTIDARRASVDTYADYWGRRWIVLPNPTYGDWEGAVLGGNYRLPIDEQRGKKRGALRY